MSLERPEYCSECGAPEVWCKCETKGCPHCGAVPKVGGGKLVHPTCDCVSESYVEYDIWQSRPLEDALSASNAKLREALEKLQIENDRQDEYLSWYQKECGDMTTTEAWFVARKEIDKKYDAKLAEEGLK